MSENDYWEKRGIDTHSDWGDDKNFLDSYRASINHPHRQLFIDFLANKDFDSLLEVGCCNGPNLFRLRDQYPNLEEPNIALAGQDINKEAIKDAINFVPGVYFTCQALPEILSPNKFYDYILADAVLMYVKDIDKALEEMKRVARKGVIIFDWDTENEEKINYSQTWNYKKRLEDAGFKDISIRSLTEQEWPSPNWIKYGRFITAQVP